MLTQGNLRCSCHAMKVLKRASQHFGLLRRAFGRFDPSVFSQMLTAYVKPHLECAVQAWQSWKKRDLVALETPLRRATKNVNSPSRLPYQHRLKALGVYSGPYRRLRGDLILVYQIFTSPNHAYRRLLKLNCNTRLRGYKLNLTTQYSRLECQRNFSLLHVCHPWNFLPEDVSSPTLSIFKKTT